jgi:hypothetical protein
MAHPGTVLGAGPWQPAEYGDRLRGAGTHPKPQVPLVFLQILLGVIFFLLFFHQKYGCDG